MPSNTQPSDVTQSNTGTSPYAASAASQAWKAHNQGAVPGSFPEEDQSNPYAADHIDPRVDKTPRATAPTTGSSLGQSPGSSPGFNEYGTTARSTGPTAGFNEHSLGQSSGTSSGLTGGSTQQTTDPTSRSAEYGSAAGARDLDNTASDTSAPIKSLASDTPSTTGNRGMMASALGAVGLGSAAAKEDRDADRTTDTPSTTTGVGSYDTPSQSGPTHHRKESIPTTAYPSGTLDSPRAMAPPVGASAAGNSTAIADEPSYGDDTGVAAVGQTSTYRKSYLGSGQPTSRIVDPDSSDSTTYRKPESSSLGRDAAIGAGVGAAGVGAASAYDGSRDQPGLSSSTGSAGQTSFYDAATAPVHGSGTTSSAIGGPTTSQGYGLEPGTTSSAVGGTTDRQFDTTPSTTGGATVPTSERHTGRDAAVAGAGAGALGAGAYEYEKDRGDSRPTGAEHFDGSAPQGYSSTSDYPGGTSKGYTSTTPYPTAGHEYSAASGYPGGASRGYDSAVPEPEQHTGRDAALGGAGVGALGAGAYEHEKRLDNERAAPTGRTTAQPYDSSAADPRTTQGYDQTTHHHTGRDAAIAGAGAGAAGAGAYEYSMHDEIEHGKKQRGHEKELEKEDKTHDKAVAKEETHHEKELEKEEKHREKEIAKEEKDHRNRLEKSEKQQEKLAAKEEKKHEKQVAKEEKHHHGEEATGVGAAGATGAGAYEYEKHHEQQGGHVMGLNKGPQDDTEEHGKKPSLIQRILHPHKSKQTQEDEPTSGLAAADAADRRAYIEHGDAGTYREDGTRRTSSSVARAGYADPPTSGYASQVTGGTGTTALAQGEKGPSGTHATGFGNTLDNR